MKSRKKTCFVKVLKSTRMKELFTKLLEEGVEHFFFASDAIKSYALQKLLDMKKKHPQIKIYIACLQNLDNWSNKDVIFLPIVLQGNAPNLDKWLEKYCDIILDVKFVLKNS